MAKRPSSIPAYKRKSKRKGGVVRFVLKLILWFFLITIGLDEIANPRLQGAKSR